MGFHLDNYPNTYVMQSLGKHCSETIFDQGMSLKELNLDSLDLIESLFELEQHYGKTLSNAELASLATVGDLIKIFDSTVISE